MKFLESKKARRGARRRRLLEKFNIKEIFVKKMKKIKKVKKSWNFDMGGKMPMGGKSRSPKKFNINDYVDSQNKKEADKRRF